MIYCIWYPSGGFGHFINSVLSIHGENFARPANMQIEFADNGNAHSVELVAPKYHHDPEFYNFTVPDQTKNYSVLIDNGINNEGEKFRNFFPDARVIKICYSDKTWPIVARTMIDKAMNSSLSDQLPVDKDGWTQTSPWAQREKYFLFLRDHPLRQQWKPSANTYSIFVDDMLDYNTLFQALGKAKIRPGNFGPVWGQWHSANYQYLKPVMSAQQIITNIKYNIRLSDIKDIWEQAVIYYYLWLEYGQEVPHNDYADFFNDTGVIRRWLQI